MSVRQLGAAGGTGTRLDHAGCSSPEDDLPVEKEAAHRSASVRRICSLEAVSRDGVSLVSVSPSSVAASSISQG